MAMIGPVMINPLFVAQSTNNKDSHWLTLDVCREFQRGKCSRTDNDCRFAHPPPNIEVQNGRVMCCFDSIKGKCQRRVPPCKYLHPPQHLKDTLLQNGRNNLLMKHVQMQTALANGMAAGLYPMTHQYIMYNGTAFNPYYTASAGTTSAAVIMPPQPPSTLPLCLPPTCLPPTYPQAQISTLSPDTLPSPGQILNGSGGMSVSGGSEDSLSNHGCDVGSADLALSSGELNNKRFTDIENNNIAVYGDQSMTTPMDSMMSGESSAYMTNSYNRFISSNNMGGDCLIPPPIQPQLIYQASLYIQGSSSVPNGLGMNCLPVVKPPLFCSPRLSEASKLDCPGADGPTYYAQVSQGQQQQVYSPQSVIPQTLAFKQMMVAAVPYPPSSGYIPLMLSDPAMARQSY